MCSRVHRCVCSWVPHGRGDEWVGSMGWTGGVEGGRWVGRGRVRGWAGGEADGGQACIRRVRVGGVWLYGGTVCVWWCTYVRACVSIDMCLWLCGPQLSVHSHLPPSVPADGGVVYAAQTQFMSVGRSHVISPRDGAFTLLAGGGSGCRPGVSSLFKRSPQTLPGSRTFRALSCAEGRAQSCSGVPAGAPRSGRSRINARLFKYQYQYQ